MARTEFKGSIKDFPLILLAGGRSSRMGIPKGLLDYQGHPWLIEQLRRFKAASGKRALVVLGFHQTYYFNRIPWLEKAVNQTVRELGLEISVVINPSPEQGQFSSLQCAIAFLQAQGPSPSPQPSPTRGEGEGSFDSSSRRKGGRTSHNSLSWKGGGVTSSPLRGEDRGEGGFFILPIDVPCPGKGVFKKLVEAFNKSLEAAIPQYQSKGGHPVLLGGDFLSRLTEIPLESPLARLDLQIQALPVKRTILVPVEDPTILLNMNSMAEFQDYTGSERSLPGLSKIKNAH